jgi:hypothetical protein
LYRGLRDRECPLWGKVRSYAINRKVPKSQLGALVGGALGGLASAAGSFSPRHIVLTTVGTIDGQWDKMRLITPSRIDHPLTDMNDFDPGCFATFVTSNDWRWDVIAKPY